MLCGVLPASLCYRCSSALIAYRCPKIAFRYAQTANEGVSKLLNEVGNCLPRLCHAKIIPTNLAGMLSPVNERRAGQPHLFVPIAASYRGKPSRPIDVWHG